jgi:hypothetical protein
MPIVNRDRYPDEVLFSESEFLEIGTRSDGARVIQVGVDGDAPLVAFAYTDDPSSEDLNVLELSSVIKFSQEPDEYQFHDKPKKLSQKVRVVHKFKIPATGEFSLTLPSNAEILTVQIQNSEFYLWALVNPKAKLCSRDFFWIRTGEEFEHENITYLTTVHFDHGKKVSHLFELKVSFSKLEKLLSQSQWREADLETFSLLKKLCGVEGCCDGSHIHQGGINQILCSDLQAIDQLWMRYSKGLFGYTAQLAVFQDFYNSFKQVQQNRNLWVKYCERLAWNTGFPALNFSLSAPKGHLPAIVGWGMGWGPVMFESIYRSLLSRLNDCNPSSSKRTKQ